MPPQARLSDMCAHGNAIVSGSPDTIVTGMAAARKGDLVSACPIPEPPGKIVRGVSVYAVKPEDNYVEAVFRDDSFLLQEKPSEDPKKPPPGGWSTLATVRFSNAELELCAEALERQVDALDWLQGSMLKTSASASGRLGICSVWQGQPQSYGSISARPVALILLSNPRKTASTSARVAGLSASNKAENLLSRRPKNTVPASPTWGY